MNSPYLLLIIESIPPEWIGTGQIIHSRHNIFIEHRQDKISNYYAQASNDDSLIQGKEATADLLLMYKVYNIMNEIPADPWYMIKENFNIRIFIPKHPFNRNVTYFNKTQNSTDTEEALFNERESNYHYLAYRHTDSDNDSMDSVTRHNIDNMMEP